jgi:SAM-dependent methyltransferase
VSKRDDDSQTDMEVGMTTAERRRRGRRRGLRVPSDNVPRRATTPPVVAPVPEDPSLAMSIAYSFATESADPMARASRETPVPSFEHHEVMPTVIDPVSGPVEQADFEMQTREMTAVDLEALGLAEAGLSSNALPIQRISSPGIEPVGPKRTGPPDAGVQLKKQLLADLLAVSPGAPLAGSATDRDVDVDVDVEGTGDPGTLDQEPDEVDGDDVEAVDGDDMGAELAEVDSAELTALEASPPRPRATEPSQARMPVTDASQPRSPMTDASQPRSPMTDASQPRSPMTEVSQPRPLAASTGVLQIGPPGSGFRPGRAQTLALTEEDLEEVREAARLATQPSARSGATSTPPPMPSAKTAEIRARVTEPASVPEIDILALEDKAAEASGEFEVDVEGIVDSRPAPAGAVSHAGAAAEPRTRQPSPPPVHGHPPALSPSISQSISPPSSQSISQPVSPPATPPRESQVIPAVRDPQHASPPPSPVAHKAPPSPPPAAKKPASAAASTPAGKPDGKGARGKPWFVDLFDEDYLRTLPFLTPQATQAEAEFVIDAMGLTPGAQVLDVGCGYGRHAMELAARGFHVVGLDMSTPLLVRGAEEANRRGLTINFVHRDMRELDFEAQFDGAYCLFSTFGYFDDETNKKTVSNIARALKPGGRVLIEILNRDYVITDLPTRVWWEGDGCVVLEEVDLNYFSSRIQVNRSVVFDDGRQLEQEISVRAYSLHEVGKLLHAAGLRVLEVSGAYHTRGRFFGNQSRHIIVLAERKDPAVT